MSDWKKDYYEIIRKHWHSGAGEFVDTNELISDLEKFIHSVREEADKEGWRKGYEQATKFAKTKAIIEKEEAIREERERQLGDWADIGKDETGQVQYHLCYKRESDGLPHLLISNWSSHSTCDNCKQNASLPPKEGEEK